MPIIRQVSLFGLQELYDLEPTHRLDAIFSTIDIEPILTVLSKRSRVGSPVKLNYVGMIYSLVARITERIPTIKDLVKRLKNDFVFRLDCGFLFSDWIPSESSYSRMIKKIVKSNVMERVEETLLTQAITEGFISDNTVAIDATHIEARDHAPFKEKDSIVPSKKRGRKSKEEKEKWLQEKAGKEANLSLYEKTIEAQLDASINDLRSLIPIDPKWGIKKNSEGKNVFWFGYKGHLAVSTKSQYILQSLFSSGNLNDGKAAIPLLKGLKERLPQLHFDYVTMDAGYDSPAIYKQVYQLGGQSIIAYNKRNEPEPLGFDKNFAPTCVREYSYRYDSYDAKYETLKYTRPKECKDCPLSEDSLCQKVYKVKITTDLRRYSAPARGSVAWKQIYKERTAVERVNAYLKEYFQLNNVRYRTGRKAKFHFDLSVLVYNASKLAIDRINQQLNQKVA
ncbi:IS1182 family transposase [Tepidibacillus marianensis]|uniref:IS1182 family transposase n=1 Tax=Tepidibacillus marianensis TaxID=3131995 RepID=UPI0030CC80F1